MQKPLLQLAKQYPVVTLTGPRQSGKTTLCKLCFPHYFYCTLEDLDAREYAQNDPRGFLKQSKRMIIDEIQRVPSLVSYIQGYVLFKGLDFYKKLNPDNRKSILIYTGESQVMRYGHKCFPYTQI